MFRKFFIISFLFCGLTGIIFPSKKEDTKLLDYCHSLEKIIVRNSIEAREMMSKNVKKFSKDISKFSISKTRGALIIKIIEKYKINKDFFVVGIIPNKIYCFAGYWIESLKPRTFESIFYEKSRKKINEFENFKDEVEGLFKDLNKEYKNIKKDFNNILNTG